MSAQVLPSSWRQTTLGEVAAPVPNAIVDGPFGSNLKLSDYVDEGVPVLQGKNITNDSFRWFDVRFISDRKATELKRSSVRVGDILIIKIGSIGYSAIVEDLNGLEFAIIPANLAKVTPDVTKVDLGYLHKWLTSVDAKRYLDSVASKTAQPALSLGKIKSLPLPLPPLAEQRRIAEVLDRADALRAKRRATLAQLDSLSASIFIDMFGDPIANPKNWPRVLFAELGENEDSRRIPVKLSDRDGRTGRYPYYGASGIIDWVDDYIFDGDRLLIGEDGANLIARASPLAYMARGKYWVNNHAHVIADNGRADLRFLEFFIEHFDLKPFISGTAQPKLNRSNLDRISVPFPPLELQREFARRVQVVEKLKTAQRASLAEMDALFASLQHRAFRGEL